MNVEILSTIARFGTGDYTPLVEKAKEWREDPWRTVGKPEEMAFYRDNRNSALECGRPKGISDERWYQKSLTADQTAFLGGTAIVEVADGVGFDGQVSLRGKAAFVEPFLEVGPLVKGELEDIKGRIQSLGSGDTEEISALLQRAEAIAPVAKGRKKGRAPIFFYGVADKTFGVPESVYGRMEAVARDVFEGFSEVASRLGSSDSIDDAIFSGNGQGADPKFLTGSVDLMLTEEGDIYVIDVGSPGVGLVCDIAYASQALGKRPSYGFDAFARSLAGKKVELNENGAGQLGFFAFEREGVRRLLAEGGADVSVVSRRGPEAVVDGEIFPSLGFDYLTRKQPLRNRVLGAMQRRLVENGAYALPSCEVMPNQDRTLKEFYFGQRIRARPELDAGVVVKKRPFFTHYLPRGGYKKPLVVPVWSREARKLSTKTQFEAFVPSLNRMDIEGLGSGLRSYEIRMYVGGIK